MGLAVSNERVRRGMAFQTAGRKFDLDVPRFPLYTLLKKSVLLNISRAFDGSTISARQQLLSLPSDAA